MTYDVYLQVISTQGHLIGLTHGKFFAEVTVDVDDHSSLFQQLMCLLLTPLMHRPQFILGLHWQLSSDFLLDKL